MNVAQVLYLIASLFLQCEIAENGPFSCEAPKETPRGPRQPFRDTLIGPLGGGLPFFVIRYIKIFSNKNSEAKLIQKLNKMELKERKVMQYVL